MGTECPASSTIADVTNNPDNSLGSMAKKMGMSAECQRIVKSHASEFMVETVGAGISFFGAVGIANTTTGAKIDRELKESGCGTFSASADKILNSTRNIGCILNNTKTDQVLKTNSGSTISVNLLPQSQSLTDSINTAMTGYTNNISDLGLAVAKLSNLALVPALERMVNKLIVARDEFAKDNPLGSNVRGSTINLSINSNVNIFNTQALTSTQISSIKSNVTDIANAAAIHKLSELSGVDALSPAAKSILQTEINKEVTAQSAIISDKIVNNKITVSSDNTLNFNVYGSIIDSNILLNITSQFDITISQLVKSGISIGNKVAAKLISTATSSDDTTVITEGLEALIAAINDGLAKQITEANKGHNAFFGSFFSMISNVFIMAAVIAVAVVFFLPSIVPSLLNIFPPWLKYALIAILVYLIVAWFISWPPFLPSKPDTRMDEMYIPDNRRGQGMRKSYIPTRPKKPEISQFTVPYGFTTVLQ